jgi:hypothetical protein
MRRQCEMTLAELPHCLRRMPGEYHSVWQQRAKRRKEQKRARERARRKKQGTKPRAAYLAVNSTSRLQPWKAEGISRRTWYYRRRQLLHRTVATIYPLAPRASRMMQHPSLPVVALCPRDRLPFGQPLHGLSTCTTPCPLR